MGRPPNLFTFASVEELQPHFRRYILKCQNEALGRHGVFKIAISGGSLPSVMSKALLAPSDGTAEDTAHFGKWEIFFADERAVPLDHEDSNYKLVKDDLYEKIPESIGRPTLRPINTEHLDNVQELADQYEKTLVHSFAAKDAVRHPVFDLILLGCGPDGHTCSLFPGHELLRETDGWVLSITDSPKPPPKRITLSLPVVTSGLNIAYLATGEEKKDVLSKIFDTEEGHSLPCGLVNEAGAERVSWFTDTKATEYVAFPKRSSL